jgi:AcrR family transcriptional regulator
MTSSGAGGARGRILAAATEQVVRQGVRGVRVEQLAREAGVAPSLLYYHFGNRAGLVRAVLDGAGGAPALAGTRAPDVTGRERVIATLLASLDDADRGTGVLRSEAIASAAFDPELRPDLEQRTGEWQSEIAALIELGQADGSIAAVPELDAAAVARQLTALIDGVRERWLADVIELERARSIVESAVEALLPS